MTNLQKHAAETNKGGNINEIIIDYVDYAKVLKDPISLEILLKHGGEIKRDYECNNSWAKFKDSDIYCNHLIEKYRRMRCI